MTLGAKDLDEWRELADRGLMMQAAEIVFKITSAAAGRPAEAIRMASHT